VRSVSSFGDRDSFYGFRAARSGTLSLRFHKLARRNQASEIAGGSRSLERTIPHPIDQLAMQRQRFRSRRQHRDARSDIRHESKRIKRKHVLVRSPKDMESGLREVFNDAPDLNTDGLMFKKLANVFGFRASDRPALRNGLGSNSKRPTTPSCRKR
jgi:hypothetical protein